MELTPAIVRITMRIMQYMIRIREIEARARPLNVSLLALCRRAGVTYSTVRRWESGVSEPGIARFEKAINALEFALLAIRKELLAALERDEVA